MRSSGYLLLKMLDGQYLHDFSGSASGVAQAIRA
jgi:hypothetical protein